MPRNGSGIYGKPPGTTAVPNTTIESVVFNAVIDDLVADANTPRPITAGGTGVNTLLALANSILALGIGGFTPIGGIIMWRGSIVDIPNGWVLCDGTLGTPDLRGRFIVGAGGIYAPATVGGVESVTLNETQIPAHTHSFSATTSSDGLHNHGSVGGGSFFEQGVGGPINGVASGSAFVGGIKVVSETAINGVHTHTVSGLTGSIGGGTSHENRPPYYALAYIMKT